MLLSYYLNIKIVENWETHKNFIIFLITVISLIQKIAKNIYVYFLCTIWKCIIIR